MVLRFLIFNRMHIRLLLVLLTIIAVGFGLAAPYYQKIFIELLTNAVQNPPPGGDPSFSLKPIALAVVLGIISQVISILMRSLAIRESVIAQQEIAERMYNHSLILESKARADRTVGQIVSYYASDVSTAGFLLEDFFPNMLSAIIPLLVAPLAVAWFYDLPPFQVMATTLGCLGVSVLLGLRQSGFFSRFKRLAEERLSIVNEWLQNIRALRVLGWTEHFEHKIIKKRQQETLNRLGMVTNGSLLNAIAQVSPLLINAVGVMALINARGQSITVGDIFVVLWTLGVFLNRPMRSVPWGIVVLLDSLTSIKRLQRYLDLPTELAQLQTVDERVQKAEVEHAEADEQARLGSGAPVGIEIDDLNLIYDGREVLSHLHLRFSAGKFIAIIGEVGAGKTQILSALLRDCNANFLRYNINQTNALALPLAKLRQHFCYVPQDGFVMSGTIRENIVFTYDASPQHDSDIIHSAKVSQFILQNEGMPHGLETEIGERGVNLSGGQKQRLSLSRAHYFDRPIILLDDSLSALDVRTEQKVVNELLLGEWANRTRILVTHRFSVLPSVDWIYFIEDGEIKAEGTFETLVRESAKVREFIHAAPEQQPVPLSKKDEVRPT